MEQVKTTLPIGVFDSGLGGLTVVREIWRQMPRERILYFADTARVPYGGRSAEEILTFNRQILRFMQQRGVKMVIAACNTSSALALEQLQSEFDLPMVGMIQPGAVVAASATKNGRIGLIATEATVKSGAYRRVWQALSPRLEVFSQACPLLVPLIEGGKAYAPETEEVLTSYLAPLKAEKVDTVVLGCTHYPFLRDLVAKIMGTGVAIIDPAAQVVAVAKEMLRTRELENVTGEGHDLFYVHGDAGTFRTLGSHLLGRELPPAVSVVLDEGSGEFVEVSTVGSEESRA